MIEYEVDTVMVIKNLLRDGNKRGCSEQLCVANDQSWRRTGEPEPLGWAYNLIQAHFARLRL